MTILGSVETPAHWEYERLDHVLARSRRVGEATSTPLSVFLIHGVVPRSDRAEENHNRLGEDLSKYLLVRPGDVVFNKLRTWQGGLGVADHHGIVSPAYFVCRSTGRAVPRFLHYLLRSKPYLDEFTRVSKWMPPSQFDITWDQLRRVPILLPPLEDQQAIADFLDAETARIDALLARRHRMLALLETRSVAIAHTAITGERLTAPQRVHAASWMSPIPSTWPVKSIGTQFEVKLGRMLNAERARGGDQRPYVRNINVRWGHVDVSDIATMDFTPEDQVMYRLRPGDLLINEGGAGVGRAAIWRGELDECFFQKSVIRLRPLGDAHPAWVLECMRVAVDRHVPNVEGNLATIPHLPAESLRVFRLPFPGRSEQDEQLAWAAEARRADGAMTRALERQVQLLRERRQALITAAVTGEIDVRTASGRGVPA